MTKIFTIRQHYANIKNDMSIIGNNKILLKMRRKTIWKCLTYFYYLEDWVFSYME